MTLVEKGKRTHWFLDRHYLKSGKGNNSQ